MSRTKGAAGERELAAALRELTGWDIRRRVRQHDGDSDLEGVPGWSIEVKRLADPTWNATKRDISGNANPAHMIRELITSPTWGMGLPSASVPQPVSKEMIPRGKRPQRSSI